MRDIVLYDRSGQPVIYKDADTLKTDTTVEGETTIFTHGVVMNDVKIPLDFSSGGNQAISVPDGYLVREATIIKPEAFNSSNIRNGVTIAGITGDFIGDTEEIQIEPNFADGNFSVEPTQKEKVISKVTIKKPASLVPENIAKDVDVGGVVGTFEGGGFDTDNLVEVFPVTEITVPSGGDGTVPVMTPLGLEAGSIYQIIWNGVGYIREAENVVYNGIPAVALGNGIAWGGENTGEPFAIGEIPEQYVSFTGGAYGLIIPLDGSITFKIGGYFITKNLSWLVKYVIFKNGDVELYRMPVLKGDICKDPVLTGAISTPTKKSTVQYDFTYAGGWSLTDGGEVDANALSNVTEDRIVYATYTSSLRSYTITFYDGESVLKSESYEYGSIPSYSPEKGGYNFIGWQPEISVVTGNAEYYAQWEEIIGVRVGSTATSCKPFIPVSAFNAQGTWSAVTWSGITSSDMLFGMYIWTDGSDIYLNTNKMLEKETATWKTKTWVSAPFSVSSFYVWTDGTDIYYSSGSNQYVLDKATSTWSAKTWSGIGNFNGNRVWTDGTDIYYSDAKNHYVLNKTNYTWSPKTWYGLSSFYGEYIWTDGTDIYYSNSSSYVLDKVTSTWSAKTWSGISSLNGNNIWTDGENIYCSNSSTYQYRLNKETGTWTNASWNGISNPTGTAFWTDGANLYCSIDNTKQYVLKT